VSASRVLIVDDEDDIRTILGVTLRRAGYAVTPAADGAEALASLAAELPDLVVLDIMMPVMDGMATLRRIREDARTRELPVILLTAKGQLVDRMAGFEMGADDYVAKPFEPSELLARIRALLRRTEQARLVNPLIGLLEQWSTPDGLAGLGRDLSAARDIQLRLLPPVPEQLAGLEAGAVMVSSAVVGGDFFDIVRLGDRVGVVVGDVSGKGIAAALLMVMVRTLLREIAAGGGEPAAILSRLNASLVRDLPAAMFVTLALVGLDAAQPGRLTVASAGHPPPVIRRRGQPAVSMEVGGPLLGVFPEVEFVQQEVTLGAGDHLVLFTDGVVETPDEHGRRGGVEKLYGLLARLGDLPAADTARAIAEAVVGGQHRGVRDDVAVFALRR
jgi:sigma-B regulation protein RsbU (phosphoserine phosphatase)